MEKHYLFRDFCGGAVYLFKNKNELDIFFKKYVELYVEGGKYDMPKKGVCQDYEIDEIDFITGENAINDFLGIDF